LKFILYQKARCRNRITDYRCQENVWNFLTERRFGDRDFTKIDV